MRLIEVADLKKFIRENVCAIGDDHLLLVAGDDSRWHEALPLVKTAYSVDKVVEELESEKRYGSKYDSYYEENLYRGEMFENDVNNKTIDKAIEIVKQGGVYDDVCEWTLTDTRKVMPYKTSCGNEDLYDHRWEFCPYCRKKIKVVE